MNKKQNLRLKIKDIRNNGHFAGLDSVIIQNLFQTNVYISSHSLMIYYPIQSEINLLSILKSDKKVSFPCIREEKIVPYVYSGTFCEGQYKIKEPSNSRPIDIENLDLVIVPALCVDLKGYRIGYGKGYYDRFIKTLNRKKTKLLTLMYDEFVLDDICPESFDERVDYIVTEKRVIKIG